MNTSKFFYIGIRVVVVLVILGTVTLAVSVNSESRGNAFDLTDAVFLSVTDIPYSTIVYADVSRHPNRHEIYRSVDDGYTWYLVGSDLSLPINTLSVDSRNQAVLYAGTEGGPLGSTNNLWRSDDSGRTWRNFILPLPANREQIIPDVTAIATDPNRSDIIYVGTAGLGVYRVKANGLGYELVGGLPLAGAQVKQLTVAADSRLYALTDSGLYVTTGSTWRAIDTVPEFPLTFTVAPSNPDIIYAGSASTGLHRSVDGGDTWHCLNAGLDMIPGIALRINSLAVDELDADHLVVSTAYGVGSQIVPAGIYESRDGGRHWTPLDTEAQFIETLRIAENNIQAISNAGAMLYIGQPEPSPPTGSRGGTVAFGTSGTLVMVVLIMSGLASLVISLHLRWAADNRQNIDYLRKEVTK